MMVNAAKPLSPVYLPVIGVIIVNQSFSVKKAEQIALERRCGPGLASQEVNCFFYLAHCGPELSFSYKRPRAE